MPTGILYTKSSAVPVLALDVLLTGITCGVSENAMEVRVLGRTMSRLLREGWFFYGRLPCLASCRHFLLHNLLRQRLDLLGVWANFLHRLFIYLLANTQRRPLPRRHSDTNPRQLVFPQVPHPPIHNDRVCIPCFDDPLVYASLKVLLTLFMDERSSEDGPHRALCRKWYRARCRDTQRAGSMPSEMRKEVQWVMMVRPEVNLGDGDGMCTGNRHWGIQGSARDDHGGNVGLGQHDWCFIVFARLCGRSGSIKKFGAGL